MCSNLSERCRAGHGRGTQRRSGTWPHTPPRPGSAQPAAHSFGGLADPARLRDLTTALIVVGTCEPPARRCVSRTSRQRWVQGQGGMALHPAKRSCHRPFGSTRLWRQNLAAPQHRTSRRQPRECGGQWGRVRRCPRRRPRGTVNARANRLYGRAHAHDCRCSARELRPTPGRIGGWRFPHGAEGQ